MKYIKKDRKLIAANKKSVSIYMNYFSPGITLPKKIDNKYTRLISHGLLNLLVRLSFTLGIYNLMYKKVQLDDDAHIIIEGDGKFRNKVKLISKENKLVVVKKVYNKKQYDQEKEFYDKYLQGSDIIILPKHKFLPANTIEYDFIHAKSFQRNIYSGKIGFDKAIKYFFSLKKDLKQLYKNNMTLVHGDFSPLNLLIIDGKFVLIDYSDSMDYHLEFDLYVLLYSLLFSYRKIEVNEKTIINFKYKKNNVFDFLSVDKNLFSKLEKKFHNLREVKHPGMYR